MRFPTVSFAFFPDFWLVFDLDLVTAVGGCCCASGCCCAIADLLFVATGSGPAFFAVFVLVVFGEVGDGEAGIAEVDAGIGFFFLCFEGEEVVDRFELD